MFSIPVLEELALSINPLWGILAAASIVLAVTLPVWALSTLARGALIEGAGALDAGRETAFRQTFAAAWRKGWTLLGIGLLPAIPALILLLGALGAAAIYAGTPVMNGMEQGPGLRSLGLITAALTCVSLPLLVVLNLLRAFANRACMLEGCGVLAAYRRGFSVLVDNVGSALLLFLLQIAMSITLGLVLLSSALCCLLWPLLLVAQGAAAAYFSVMWTLAWRLWTNAAKAV
jgi:hypothetical protein